MRATRVQERAQWHEPHATRGEEDIGSVARERDTAYRHVCRQAWRVEAGEVATRLFTPVPSQRLPRHAGVVLRGNAPQNTIVPALPHEQRVHARSPAAVTRTYGINGSVQRSVNAAINVGKILSVMPTMCYKQPAQRTYGMVYSAW